MGFGWFLVSDDLEANDDREMACILQELTFPYSSKEPDVTAAELTRLDALADQLELKRLERLCVLQDPSTVSANSKVLSTRFVRTWREKHNSKGEPIWLRRSRFVAREFAWLEPEREREPFQSSFGQHHITHCAYGFLGDA